MNFETWWDDPDDSHDKRVARESWEASRRDLKKKRIRLFYFLVACGLAFALVYWLIFIFME
jgi:hypothetical protein